MSTQTAVRTHCPNCNAKLHRPDLSLCAYCAMPLSITDKPVMVDDETILRLKRMREHAAFPAAMAFTPRSAMVETRAAKLLSLGSTLGVVALLLAAVALVRLSTDGWVAPLPIAAAVFLAGAIVCLTMPGMLRAQDAARPTLRRPALVMLRRSETSATGGGTIYFFTLRFDDGSEGEFRRLGQGTMSEPMSNGYSGIAYTRGEDLVDFRRLA